MHSGQEGESSYENTCAAQTSEPLETLIKEHKRALTYGGSETVSASETSKR